MIDHEKLIAFLEPRIDPELLEFIKGRLVDPEHDSIQDAYGALTRAIDGIDREIELGNQILTMRAMQYASTLSPEQEEQVLRRLLQ